MAKYLLDTHTAIWAFTDDVKLSRKARNLIADNSVNLCVSIASIWEIAIKVGAGKADFIGNVSFYITQLQDNGLELLGIDASHLRYVETLPLIHRDPFDRLLVATAKIEDMTIITADENIHKYNVDYSW